MTVAITFIAGIVVGIILTFVWCLLVAGSTDPVEWR